MSEVTEGGNAHMAVSSSDPGSAAVAHAGGRSAVGLVQINNSFSGQNYLPYSVGILQAYTQRHAKNPERFHFLAPLYKRAAISDAVDDLLAADVVGFSTYVWNAQISLEIARRLKLRRPDVIIVFGGPHVPDNAEQLLRDHPFIDLAIHKEGEITFLRMLEQLPSRDWSKLEGVSFIGPAGYMQTANGPRIRNLDDIPSPFLEGVFDPLIADNPDETWIGLWETNRGCPFQCTFCDWGSAVANKVNQFGLDRIKSEVQWFARQKIDFVFCCDANFGLLKRDLLIAEYIAEVKHTTGYPKALSVQNTKNATERAYATQKMLSDSGLNKGVTLSMQSIDADTLLAVKRDNISLKTYFELQRRFARDRVETYSDMILGLPGESYDSFVNGIATLIENGQHNRIQFNNLSILPNAEMGDPAYQQRFGMVTVRSEIINIHGQRVAIGDDVPEVQDLVIATASMPAEDWVRTRGICWMVNLLHFDKLLQIPVVLAHQKLDAGYREIFEAFMNVDAKAYPLLGEIRDFFLHEARAIQQGGAEYVYSAEWLGIYWPHDEYIFVKMTAEGRLADFYHEAGDLLNKVMARKAAGDDLGLLAEAVRVNHLLVNQPFADDDLVVETASNLLEFYQAARNGEDMQLRRKPSSIRINRRGQSRDDFLTWCREIVWWGNKKGAYLYGHAPAPVSLELAGHY
jgi:tRNA A37 methylthiotransferase MiaB